MIHITYFEVGAVPILDFIFIVLSIFWLLEFLLFKSRTGKNENDDSRSFPWIMFSVLLVITVSVVSRETDIILLPYAPVTYAGIVLFAAGITLRYWGILELGKQFTRDVQVRAEDRIVSSGPFRILRHPLYTGLLLIVLGFSLYMNSIAGFLIVWVVFLPFLLRRIRLEEEMLKQGFGKEYESWMKTRYRLLPYIY